MATRKKSKKRPAASTKKSAPAKRSATRSAAAPKSKKKAIGPKKRAKPESLRLRSLMPSLTCDDIALSLRFYRDGLGFAVKEEWNEKGEVIGYHLVAGTTELGIGQDDWGKGRDRKKGVGFRLYCETTQDVDALAARVVAAGFPLAEAPADQSWGVRAFAVADPDGFKISIFRKVKKSR